jgi:hypothetical protein
MAEGGVVIATTHVCMKKYYVKLRTEEIRPPVTKAYMVPSLRNDLISVKSLHHQGYYTVIHDADPEVYGTQCILHL